ncbi:MAG: hypothetical protein F6K47_34185 [Symploca sp. SIO2E6]|nr:hypothetical protein [Symploca sp. SIO2E6]
MQYGLKRLTEVVKLNLQLRAQPIMWMGIKSVLQHIGQQQVYDDRTLLVPKPKINSGF